MAVNLNSTGAVTLSTGDLEIGAVEIKDQDSTTRADVDNGTTHDRLLVALADGDTLVNVIAGLNAIKSDLSGIAGTATSVGSGNLGNGVQRVAIATDDISMVALLAAIATHLSAAPASAILSGFQVEDSVPTEESDGDIATPWMDTFRRLVPKGFDLGQDAQQITNVAPALTLAPITVFTQLTAPGSTISVSMENFHHLTFQYVVASIDTSVDVRVEGSHDDTNWFNLNDDRIDTQETGNGTFLLHKSNIKSKHVRFTFVSEVGGTAATIDVDLMRGN